MKLFLTQVDHCRIGPTVHRFRYATLSALVDLNRLGTCGGTMLFGYNRHAVFSLRDRDYLRGQSGSIKERLLSYLRSAGHPTDWERIELLTSPRFLGYAFNPVSFYLCYHAGEAKPSLCAAEVNNTFGESHFYIAEPARDNPSRRTAKFTAAKAFHVSPFYDRSGDYWFYAARDENKIDIRVNIVRNGEIVFTSGVRGALDGRASAAKTVYYGFRYGWLTVPRIFWQAARLHFQKRLPIYSKPIPDSEWTIKKRSPNIREKFAQRLIERYLSRLQRGELTMELPSGSVRRFGRPGNGLNGNIRINDWSFFSRVLFGGDVVFGECYTEGIWSSSDLATLLGMFADNVPYFNDRNILFTKVRQCINAFIHRRRSNTRRGSKENIAAHYDLGNELFRRFLDDRLVYSCAVFEKPGDSLEQAQLNKLQKVIRKARIEPEHRVLEIGSGWGAFAIEVAKTTGCHVTTVTLSEEQLAETRRKVEAEGLTDRIEVLLCDYREVQGKFDRIVSIEMLEAVGHENLGLFFETCNRLLKPDGVVALQFITVPDQNYEAYRTGCDWIQKYIFPGGHCPSLSAVCSAATSRSPFLVDDVENIGPSYARTLREWRERFLRNSSELLALGYDERFQRMWEYYLCYCEAGFATRSLGTLQVVLTRPNNNGLGQCPGYQWGKPVEG